MPVHRTTSGFSLVELSIVLVILGLLTGGILAGQSLIRAAELRSISTDINRYVTATQTFRDKYFALPGDMTNATAFWGTDNVACPNGGGTTGTCNGNGDGNIGSPTGVGSICETQQFWRQLSLAGLVEGQYRTFTAGSCFTGGGNHVFGLHSPRTRISNAGVVISALQNISANGAFPTNLGFIGNYGNMFFLGNSSANALAMAPFLKPEEQWNIDTKMDDSRPATGSLVSIYPGTYAPAAGASGCVTTNVAATAEYSLSNSAQACGMMFKAGF